VEPTSHQKIYFNWRPPDLDAQKDMIGEKHERDILNATTDAIRKEALRQIYEKISPHAWHPESLTGITESARGNEMQAIEGSNSESNTSTVDFLELSTQYGVHHQRAPTRLGYCAVPSLCMLGCVRRGVVGISVAFSEDRRIRCL
jgi:hypothetical protein